MQKSFNNERGGIVFWMIMMPFIVSALILIIYGGNAYIVKDISRSKLENALLSAVVSTNPNATLIDATAALPTFNRYLQKNLNLDANFNPLPGSVATGTVTVLKYQALPANTQDPIIGDTVHLPSLEAEISVPTFAGYNVLVFSRVAVHPPL